MEPCLAGACRPACAVSIWDSVAVFFDTTSSHEQVACRHRPGGAEALGNQALALRNGCCGARAKLHITVTAIHTCCRSSGPWPGKRLKPAGEARGCDRRQKFGATQVGH